MSCDFFEPRIAASVDRERGLRLCRFETYWNAGIWMLAKRKVVYRSVSKTVWNQTRSSSSPLKCSSQLVTTASTYDATPILPTSLATSRFKTGHTYSNAATLNQALTKRLRAKSTSVPNSQCLRITADIWRAVCTPSPQPSLSLRWTRH